MAAHRAKRAHGRIDAAGNVFQSLGEEGFRLGAVHGPKLTAKAGGNNANNHRISDFGAFQRGGVAV
jgi:hypothetical protein